MGAIPDSGRDELRANIDKLLHIQFERGKAQTHEFARLWWDNHEKWPTLNDAVVQLIVASNQRAVQKALEFSSAAQIAMKVARAQLERGENPTINITATLLGELDDLAALAAAQPEASGKDGGK